MSKLVTILYEGLANQLKAVGPSGQPYTFVRGESVEMAEQDANWFLNYPSSNYLFSKISEFETHSRKKESKKEDIVSVAESVEPTFIDSANEYHLSDE